jgi:hypothetical protein
MRLANYYIDDARLVLVPIEHLSPEGMSREFAAFLGSRRNWQAERVALFDAAFSLYWTRSAALARRTSTWPAPRLRNVGVVTDPRAVRPYVQLLNTSTWTLYETDFDPALSHPEFAAYLFTHGDRMALTGEVTTVAVHTAPWWFDRSEEECAAFTAAAARSLRPDAEGFRAIADAIPWLRELRHEELRPLVIVSPHRPIPGTGLLVPRHLEAEPPGLVTRWRDVAGRAVQSFHTAWRSPDAAAIRALLDWLAADQPRLLVTADRGRIVWDPDAPERLGPLRDELERADGIALRSILEDLRVIDRHTRAFLAAVVDAERLPAPPANTGQSGYSYLHRERRLVAYNLDEPGMERRSGPPLPYARAMLGARTAHEWAHLADAAGFVPRAATRERWAELKAALATELDATIAAAPPAIRAKIRTDLATLARDAVSPGHALTRILLTRMPDYRANLVARLFMSEEERETYVRQNIRTLRPEHPPARLWRMLVRYLYEYQYLGRDLALTAIPDPRYYLWHSTWFVDDFVTTRVLAESRFDTLAAAVAHLCASYAVDKAQLRTE